MFLPPVPDLVVDARFRLMERVGGGGMGQVFRAFDQATGRSVALKILHAELAESDDVARRFQQEGVAASRIRHPNVVELIAAGNGSCGPYLAMEFLDGQSLGAALLKAGRFSSEAAAGAILPVFDALEAAHAVGVIHRDLKPENVFLENTASGIAVRLLDFGIAKVLDPPDGAPRTRTGVVFGTPDYLSPEQATADRELDGRSDLFAAGVLLYELLTGTRPFRAVSAIATAFRVVHADPPPLGGRTTTVTPALESVVMKLLRKNPADRYATAREAANALTACAPDALERATRLAAICALPRRATTYRARSIEPTSIEPTSIEPMQVAERVAGASAAPPKHFPDRFRGRFRARVSLYRAIDSALSHELGEQARARVLEGLSREIEPTPQTDARDPLLVPLEHLEAYIEAAHERGIADAAVFRQLGRRCLDFDVAPPPLVTDQLSVAVDQAADACGRFFDFGTFSVRKLASPLLAELRAREVDPMSRGLRLVLSGVVSEIAARALGRPVACALSVGDASHMPSFTCTFRSPYEDAKRKGAGDGSSG